MGQYYCVANLTKREYLNPHEFDDGLKLREFGPSPNGNMWALAVLLAWGNGRGGGDVRVVESAEPVVGRWAGDRIVLAGDYADPIATPAAAEAALATIERLARDEAGSPRANLDRIRGVAAEVLASPPVSVMNEIGEQEPNAGPWRNVSALVQGYLERAGSPCRTEARRRDGGGA